MSRISVIGGGFSGLAASALSALQGNEVLLLEKNSRVGGRARAFEKDGFLFDMGPSWYWMPDIFENFFAQFGKLPSDFFELKKLDPGFQLFFGNNDPLPIPADQGELSELFEQIEKGSSAKLTKFLQEGKLKYEIGMQKLACRPALSWMEFAHFKVISGALRSHVFQSMRSYVRKYFKDPRLVMLMEFPVLFLGARPENIPALYSLMNYSALEQGTFYPMGGMYKIVEAMKTLAEDHGVSIITNCPVEKILVKNKKISSIKTPNGIIESDAVIASGDYHHIESDLLEPAYRNYNSSYWDKRVLAPSSLIFYVGVSKKIKKLIHHNLFFDKDFDNHARQIYDKPSWPKDPLFYVCCPSKTDPVVAPEGMENLFILIPIAPGLTDTEETREYYFSLIISRLEKECGDTIREYIITKTSYCINDFVNDYNAYKGNAYGLANTLSQTAVLKPSVKNRRIENLFYAGQLTVPGPGVPPALISGQIASQLALKYLKQNQYETII